MVSEMIFFMTFFIACQNEIANSNTTPYKEMFFNQTLDHFNFVSFGEETFQQRYLVEETWWNQGIGPIFFYTGNEDDINVLWNNTGFIHEIAPKFHALVVYAEHRFYGKSLPAGNASFTHPIIGLLTIEQALADYANLLTHLKEALNATQCPVIAFGGSYGGMLSAYFRFKYPNIVNGAIAASAPIYQVAGLTSTSMFFQAVTQKFHNALPNCESQIRKAFQILNQWATEGVVGFNRIRKTFNLCNDISNFTKFQHFLSWARNAFVFVAMVNYPYPTDFSGKLPGHPVKAMCQQVFSTSVPTKGLALAVSLLYNASGDKECFDVEKFTPCADPTGCGEGENSRAWDFQACTEVNFEGGSNNVTDMFPDLPFTAQMRDEYCLTTWGVTPRRKWLKTHLWGRDITHSTNIVFSNGDLDPWTQGGVTHNVSSGIRTILIKGGAHHLDLRRSNHADPKSVVTARSFEVMMIYSWIKQKSKNM